MCLQQRIFHGINQEEEMYQFQAGYISLPCLNQQNKFQEQVPKSMGKYFTLETLKSIRNMMNIKNPALIIFLQKQKHNDFKGVGNIHMSIKLWLHFSILSVSASR